MTDEIDLIAERQAKQRHLESLESFLGSPAHLGFVAARRSEIKSTEEAIVLLDPIERKDEIEGLKLRGELRLLIELVETFEDARVALKARIEELLERENQNAENTKV